MDSQTGTKLQHMMTSFPRGIALTAEFLRNNGFDLRLLSYYKRSRWLGVSGTGPTESGAKRSIGGEVSPLSRGSLNFRFTAAHGHHSNCRVTAITVKQPVAPFTFLVLPGKGFRNGSRNMTGE